MYEESLD